jgi:phosphatidylinositol-3-phosphatase
VHISPLSIPRLGAVAPAIVAFCVVLPIACGLTPPSPPPPSLTAAAMPDTGHIFVLMLENSEFGGIIDNPNAPYLNQLAGQYALAEQYYGVSHPSLPNYLALLGGDTFGISSDCTDCLLDKPNLADQIEAHGKTWKSYQEDLPAPCSHQSSVGGYHVWHNPFLYFHDIRDNQTRCQRVVPLDELAADIQHASLPDFVWISPNEQHNLHNVGSVVEGDRWLSTFVPQILASDAWRQNGVLFIVWDEGDTDAGCCGVATGGHIPMLVIAPRGRSGYRSTVPVTHYNLLRTIEDLWGLDHVGRSADPASQPLVDFFAEPISGQAY